MHRNDRFAELESVVALSMLVKNYKISVKQEPQFSGETVDQTRARIFQMVIGVTQTYVTTSMSPFNWHQYRIQPKTCSTRFYQACLAFPTSTYLAKDNYQHHSIIPTSCESWLDQRPLLSDSCAISIIIWRWRVRLRHILTVTNPATF